MINALKFNQTINFTSKKNITTDCKHYNNSPIQESNLNNIPNSYYSRIAIEQIQSSNESKHTLKNYQGCLLGGAIGDALGWPVEFQSLSFIKKKYGENGITDLQLVENKAEITDDTQMTIFTADGLLKSAIRNFNENEIPDMSIIYESYQDWLNTQYGSIPKTNKGWIANIQDLYSKRAPGGTCINSLKSGKIGTLEKTINLSKGCGGVMRVAPVGLMYYKNPELAFEIGARCAALTHGHPGAYLPAGVHASIIANIIQGKNIEEAINNSIEILKYYEGNESTLKLIERAKFYAKTNFDSNNAIKRLGEGWCGDEAIAIAIYCILKSPENFEKALIMAVNHNGDSDSTGAIVGNILGAYLGTDKIPVKWKNSVELSNELSQLAIDLHAKPSEITDVKKYN